MSLSKLDANQVMRSIYDDATNELRVKATLNPGGSSEIVIDHADDSIRLGDGTNLTTVSLRKLLLTQHLYYHFLAIQVV